MKIFFLLIFLATALQAMSQTFYKGVSNNDYQNLMKNGLNYVQTGDETTDELVENALKANWKVTPYKIIEKSDEKSMKPDDIQLVFLANDVFPVPLELAIVSTESMQKKGFDLYGTIAIANITGFSAGTINQENINQFLPFLISAFNDMANKMNAHKIDKRGLPYFNQIHELYLPNAVALKTKTLLIIDSDKSNVNEAELKKAGIKYSFMTIEEFKQIPLSDYADYCLLYLNASQFSDITIFNLENQTIAYTRHYIKYISKLDKEDIKSILSSWK